MAPITDSHLVNPWGIAFGPTTPLWVANNGTSTSTLYSTNPAPAQLPLVVTTQPAPTGTVFNDTTEFALPDGTASRFLFASVSGELSAWGGGTQTTTTASAPGAAFTGLALAHTMDGARLYAADAASTNVLVYNGKWQLVDILTDPTLPKGLTTYNVAAIGKQIYVSYAPPPGVDSDVLGAIDVFKPNGRLQRRLVTGGVLNGPWGMVVAPHTWGRFADALLVGNEDGGQINAFNPHSGRFLGTVKDAHGQPIGEDGLWGMAFGNGVIGTPNDLVIAIGTTSTNTASSHSFTPPPRAAVNLAPSIGLRWAAGRPPPPRPAGPGLVLDLDASIVVRHFENGLRPVWSGEARVGAEPAGTVVLFSEPAEHQQQLAEHHLSHHHLLE